MKKIIIFALLITIGAFLSCYNPLWGPVDIVTFGTVETLIDTGPANAVAAFGQYAYVVTTEGIKVVYIAGNVRESRIVYVHEDIPNVKDINIIADAGNFRLIAINYAAVHHTDIGVNPVALNFASLAAAREKRNINVARTESGDEYIYITSPENIFRYDSTVASNGRSPQGSLASDIQDGLQYYEKSISTWLYVYVDRKRISVNMGIPNLEISDCKNLVINDNIAYIATAQGLKIVRITLSSIELLSDLNVGDSSDILKEGNNVYLATSSGVKVVDVSDSSKPKLSGAIASRNVNGIYILGNTLFIACEKGLRIATLN